MKERRLTHASPISCGHLPFVEAKNMVDHFSFPLGDSEHMYQFE